MITCHLRYVIDSTKLPEFEQYCRMWLPLIKKFGGIHHGYLLPSEGASDIALGSFSFPSFADYEQYRIKSLDDAECQAAFRFAKDTGCFLRYERTFSGRCSMTRTVPDDMPGASLHRWLIEHALPIWSSTGVDHAGGGFFEAIDLQGRAVEAPRRTRVVARQIYVFATAARRGWLAGVDPLVEHGLAFLQQRSRRPDGTFASSVRPDGTPVDGGFDLYEQAFVLFALAAARRDRPDRVALDAEAQALLGMLRRHWPHPMAGFEESMPRTLPLRSNPHMHLLEAALEWAEVASPADQPLWLALADELVQLCLTRFIDAETGALGEHFDGEWRPMPGGTGQVVEPGHQFEWGWLLTRWAERGGDVKALAAARRLIAIGESKGVDAARGVAVNALDQGLQVTDANAKVWPQTERIKAWHARFTGAADPPSRAAARDRLQAACDSLERYLLPAHAGLWQEVMEARGGFTAQHCRASSLYHIVCAIDTLGHRSA